MDSSEVEVARKPIRMGVSSCLLGEKVRFDGGHREDSFITTTLAPYVEFFPVCPEVEIGLGIPRESIRLEGNPHNPRLVAPRSGIDLTEQMNAFTSRHMKGLAEIGLHGYILKEDSPSCGMERVRVYTGSGMPVRNGVGLYAAALLATFPALPIEEEGRLGDMPIRENFIERVCSYYRWREFLTTQPKPHDLVQFHTRHKLSLLSHSPRHYRDMGRLVATAGQAPIEGLLAQYGNLLMDGLKARATRKKHSNVLYHLLGYLKKALDAQDKAELASCIEEYGQGLVPLVVPITLFKHHFRRHPIPWIMEQTYINPYPVEVMLRNHV